MRCSSPHTFFWNSEPSLASGRLKSLSSPLKYAVSCALRLVEQRVARALLARLGRAEVDRGDQSGRGVDAQAADR